MRQLTYLSAQDMKRLRDIAGNYSYADTYIYIRYTLTHSLVFTFTVQHRRMWVPYAGTGFNIYLFASASRNALKPIK